VAPWLQGLFPTYWTKNSLNLSLMAFTRSIGASITLVALPALVIKWGGGVSTLGRVVFLEMVLAAVIALPRATAVQRFGERGVLLFASVIETVALAAIAGPSLLWAGAGRLFQGLADKTNFSVSTKVLFDETDSNNNRARVRSFFSTAQSVGNLVGPVAGGLLAAISLQAAVLVGAALSAMNIPLTNALLIFSSGRQQSGERTTGLNRLIGMHIRRLIENRFLFFMSLVIAALSLFDVFMSAILEVHLLKQHHFTVAQLGLLLSISSLVPIALAMPVAAVVDRAGRITPLALDALFIGGGIWGLSFSPLPYWVVVGLMASILLGLSFANSAITTLYGDLTRPSVRMSEMEAVGTIRTIAGAVLALVVARYYDSFPVLTVRAIAAVMVMGPAFLVVLDLSQRRARKHPEQDTNAMKPVAPTV